MTKYKILLASKSPRRKELLERLGYSFDVISNDCDEVFPENLETEKIASYLSELKANAYSSLKKDEVLITADTIVALDSEILGKPKDEDHAREFSGNSPAKPTKFIQESPSEQQIMK